LFPITNKISEIWVLICFFYQNKLLKIIEKLIMNFCLFLENFLKIQ
jgi:hypothetical protein